MFPFLLILMSIVWSSSLWAQEAYKQYTTLSYAEIDSMAELYYESGAYAKAIPFMQAGREKAKQAFGEQDSTFAKYTSDLGFYYKKIRQYDKALPLYIQAKNIREIVLGKEHEDFAISLNNLGYLYSSMGQYDQALVFFIQSKDIKEKILGENHPDLASALSSLGSIYESMGDYDKALPLYLRAVKMAENSDLAISLVNLASLYYSMGQYEQALALFIQSKDIKEKVFGKEHPEVATSLVQMAQLYASLGQFEKALPLALQAKNILVRTLGKEHPYTLIALNDLAIYYEELGEYEKARALYIQVKNSREKVLGKEHLDFALSLNSLGAFYLKIKDYEKVLPLFVQAKTIYGKVLGEEHPLFGKSLNNLATAYRSMGDHEQALSCYIQSMKIAEQVVGKEHPDFIVALNNLAYLNQEMGNYEQAWKQLKQAMSSSSTLSVRHKLDASWSDSLKNAPYVSNKHVSNMIHSLDNVYVLLQKDSLAHPIQKQVIVADLALALLSRYRNQVSSEKDKLRMLKQSNEWLLRSLKVLEASARANKAFHLADENKSVLLLQATKSEASYRLGELPDSLIWQDKTLRKKQSQLQAKLLDRGPETEKDSLLNELNEVNQEIEAFLRMIEKDYPKYHALKYQQSDAKAEEIQALLDEKTALIEYVIADSKVHIFRVDKKSVSWHQEAVLDSTLSAKIKAFHGSLSDYRAIMENEVQNYQNYTELAHWFYQKLLQPVLKGDDGIENLIIISDGELGHLPFESFLVEPAPGEASYKDLHYLLKDFNISYSYSATLWKENKTAEARENNGELLALAARYSENLDSALLRSRLPTARQMREGLQPLPAARREVEVLSEQYQGYFAFDSLATERVLQEKAGDYAIIHLATHGLLDEKRPILSSLALTEDGDSLYDNFWQAHEISKMELNAHLVVLSACETGYGRFETGNGIASLARSFMYAGVPSLVVSLWQVSDASTSAIMQNLYAHLADGLDKAEALRQAKLDYIAQAENSMMAHPAFWSPFILMGDSQPVDLAEKGGWPWYGLGGVALLLGLILFAVRRKARGE